MRYLPKNILTIPDAETLDTLICVARLPRFPFGLQLSEELPSLDALPSVPPTRGLRAEYVSWVPLYTAACRGPGRDSIEECCVGTPQVKVVSTQALEYEVFGMVDGA